MAASSASESAARSTTRIAILRRAESAAAIQRIYLGKRRGRVEQKDAIDSGACSVYDPQTRTMVDAIQRSMIASGASPATATQQAYASIFGIVQKQATMMAFNDAFRVLMYLFLAMLPLVLIMKKPRTQRGPAATH